VTLVQPALSIAYCNTGVSYKWLYFVLDVLLTVEHVKDVLSVEVQKTDSLLLSVDRYLLEENESCDACKFCFAFKYLL